MFELLGVTSHLEAEQESDENQEQQSLSCGCYGSRCVRLECLQCGFDEEFLQGASGICSPAIPSLFRSSRGVPPMGRVGYRGMIEGVSSQPRTVDTPNREVAAASTLLVWHLKWSLAESNGGAKMLSILLDTFRDSESCESRYPFLAVYESARLEYTLSERLSPVKQDILRDWAGKVNDQGVPHARLIRDTRVS